MTRIASHKSVMTLFASPTCVLSHCIRLVLHEKDVIAAMNFFDPNNPPEDVLEVNPSAGTSPTLIERDLVLYDARIIMEYLDERFPHPPLHRMDPISRARSRMVIKRIDQDWYQLLNKIQNAGERRSTKAKKMLKEGLIVAKPIFEANPYFMSDKYSLIDCTMAPLLWRLPSIGINIKTLGTAVIDYADRVFSREAFRNSLSDAEKNMVL